MITLATIEKTVLTLSGMLADAVPRGRTITFGIESQTVKHSASWLTLVHSDEGVLTSFLQATETTEHPVIEGGLDIALQMPEQVWLEVGEWGERRLIEAADKREFTVTGKLPFFIRNVRTILRLTESIAVTLKAHSEAD